VISLLLVLMVVMLVVKFWPFLVAAMVLYGLWRWGIEPSRETRDRQVRERLRHARARQEIDNIAFATARAMCQAATQGEVIEGTCHEVEVER